MGIHSFAELQKKYFPNCIDYVPLSVFAGRRIALDMGIVMFANFSIAVSRVVDATNLAVDKPDISKIYSLALDICLVKIRMFLSYGITPVCCFDSKPHALKHSAVDSKKTEEREKMAKSLEELETILATSDILLISQTTTQDYAKLLKRTIRIDSNFIIMLTEVLQRMGIPTIHAKDMGLMSNDAEAICAMLCVPGNDYCVAAYTDDTDIHAYGCNYAILDIEDRYEQVDGVRKSMHVAKVRSLSKILAEIQMTFAEFLDLCILMGNDFNNNLVNHGPKKNYDLIRQHKNLETISQIKDLSPIPYTEVRKMFSSSITRPPVPLNCDWNITKAQTEMVPLFREKNLEKVLPSFQNVLSNFQSVAQIK